MNIKKLLLIILVVGLLGTGAYYGFKSITRVSEIRSLDYEYTSGWGSGHKVYSIRCDGKCTETIKCNDKCIATVKTDKMQEEATHELSRETMDKLTDIFSKYCVKFWNGFDKKRDMMDGNSFELKMTIQNGKVIKAKGSMSFPINFNKVAKEMDNVFQEEFKEEMKTDD